MKNISTKSIFLYLFILSAVFTGCRGEDEPITPTAEQTFGIRHDKSLSEYEAIATLKDAEYPEFGAVILFKYSLDGSDRYDYSASGTLINENWILTAGHNFFIEGQKEGVAKVGGIKVVTGNDPNNPDNTYNVERLEFHPTWLKENNGFLYANDFCLVKLATPIKNITPVELYRTSTETIGSQVWFCGFGDYRKISGGSSESYSKKHAMENTLDRKVTGITTSINSVNYVGGLLAFDFDHPSGTINALGDDYFSEDEKLLGEGTSSEEAREFEGCTVEGDSGGPLFVRDGDTWKLAGVLSGGLSELVPNYKPSSYGDVSIFTRVSQNISWIESIVQ